jgi:hypothetical protein
MKVKLVFILEKDFTNINEIKNNFVNNRINAKIITLNI